MQLELRLFENYLGGSLGDRRGSPWILQAVV